MVTLNIATKDGPRPQPAVVMWLDVGGKRHKFAAHDGRLTDFRTGFGCGDFRGEGLLAHVDDPLARRLTPRQCAQRRLDRIVARHGVEVVLFRLASKPTLNA